MLARRIMDVVVSAVLLLVLAPLLGLVALIVAMDVGRPIIFRHHRPGRHGHPFVLHKFRTMRDLAGRSGEPLPDAERMTRVGRLLRATSLDELPELWDVLRGTMSLVGPRPLLAGYLPRYTLRQARRHEVPPGITGWAQINGRNDVSWSDKLEMDVWYVEHRTLVLDVWILLRTLAVPFTRRGIARAGHATAPAFEGAPDAVPVTSDGRHRLPTVVHVTTIDLSLVALLLPQLTAIRAAGFHVLGASAPGAAVSELEAAGIPHLPLHHSTRRAAPLRDVLAFLELLRLLRRIRPDILHTHNPKPGLYGRIAGRLARVPLVVNTVHGLYATPDDPRARRAIVYGLERIAAAFSDAELVQNDEDLPVLRRLRVPEHRLHLLGNGIDLVRFAPERWSGAGERVREQWGVHKDRVVIGFVGRLVAEKGLPELLEAFRRLRARCPEVALVLVGDVDPSKRDAFGSEDLDAARADGAVVVGWQHPIEPCYLGFDLLALPSHREGFPRAPMEAAAMGRAVVATDVRGCRQAVEHGSTGMLVPVRDAGALESALARLVADSDLRDQYGRNGRMLAADRFDVRRQVETTLRVYRGDRRRRR